jgi:hypothetical protein
MTIVIDTRTYENDIGKTGTLACFFYINKQAGMPILPKRKN